MISVLLQRPISFPSPCRFFFIFTPTPVVRFRSETHENGAAPFPSGHHPDTPSSARNLFANGDEIFDTRFALQANNRFDQNTGHRRPVCTRSKHVFRGASDPELDPLNGKRDVVRELTNVARSVYRRAPYGVIRRQRSAPTSLGRPSNDFMVTSLSGRTKIEKPVCENNRTSLTSLTCAVGSVNLNARLQE